MLTTVLLRKEKHRERLRGHSFLGGIFLLNFSLLIVLLNVPAWAGEVKDFSILATGTLRLEKEAKVLSGAVGVNDRNPAISSGGYELILEKDVLIEDGSSLAAPRIHIKKGSEIKGDVSYRDELKVDTGAELSGDVTVLDQPGDWPLVVITPSPVCAPDATRPVSVAGGHAATLIPGAYGAVKIGKESVLTLEEGTYHVLSVEIEKEAKVYYNGPVTLCVAGEFETGKESLISPSPESGWKAADLQVHAHGMTGGEGDDGDGDDDGGEEDEDDEDGVRVGSNSIVFGRIWALNGTIKVEKACQVTGSLTARDIVIAKGTVVVHDTAPTLPDTTPPQIFSINPADGSTVDTLTPTISAGFSDGDSGVDASGARVLLNAVDVTAQAAVSVTGFTLTPSGLTEGPQVLEIFVKDLAGNEAQAITHWTIDIDVTLPEITGIQPGEGVVLKDASPLLSAVFSDTDSGVDPAATRILLDNQDITALTGATAGGFSYTVTPDLSDGPHILTIQVGDLSGNHAQAARGFTTDVTPPRITITIPADGSILATATPEISGAWNDGATAVDPSSAKVFVDGAAVSLTGAVITETGFQVPVTTSLSDGPHTVIVEVSDVAGNAGQSPSAGWTTDITPPVVNNVTPANGSVLTANVPTISVTYTDAVSGIDPAGIAILLDGADVTAMAAVTETSLTYVPTAPLNDGTHQAAIRVVDVADNFVDVNINFQVITDTLAPTISNLTPANGTYLNTAAPVFSASFSDNLSGVSPGSVLLMLDSVDITGTATISEAGFTATTSALSEGEHRLTVTVRDFNGNQGQAATVWTVDTIPPVVTALQTPSANAQGWNNTDVAVSFSATDSGGSGILTVSPVAIVTAEGGGQAVTGSATDRAGNSAAVTATVNVDKTAPAVAISSPSDGAVVYETSVTVTGAVTDNLSGPAAVLCNSAAAVVSATAWTCDVPVTDGDNSISVSATDAAGNSVMTSVTVRHVTGASIRITSPQSLITVGASPIDVTGTVSGNAVSVFVNGIAAPVANGTFAVTGIVLTEGMNTIIATAYDNLNNVTTASVNVTLDSTAPNVVIVSPKNGDVLRSSAVTVTGLMNDIVRGTVNAGQGRVLVNGIEAVVSNRGFLAENVPLNPGVNTITAVGADQVGNISRASIAVTFNTAPAKGLTITGGSNQTGVIGTQMPVPLSVVLRDANGSPISGGTVIFEVVDNNGKVTAVDENLVLAKSPSGHRVALQSDGNGAARVNYTLGTWAGAGNNRVEVSTTGVKERAVFIASATASAAAFVHVGSGGDQRGAVNHLLPEPLVATVTDTGHNPVEGVPVTFTVKKGGGVFTNDAGTMTVTTDSDGRATVNMILGPTEGNDVHWAEAAFPGNTGSPAIFVATGLIPGDPGETRISGVILDNMNQPVPGVMARVDGTTRQDASDSQGQFVIDNVPIGPVHLIIEGSTATVPGEWPLLSFELTTIAGANNTLGKPIYILPIDIARAKRVGGNKDVVYTLPEVPGFSLTVKAGSVTFPDGSREGLISVTPVHMDKVPMSPPYGLQSRFMITIQPPGAVFDPPAPLSLPNTDGLERGEKVNLFSFDHDLGAFVSIGPGSVSSDGIRVVSDPGVGVIKAGWHCGANPQPVGMCQSEPPMCGGQLTGCGACEICDTTNCWRLPDCYEACGGARCGSCEDCVEESCVVETRGNPPCQPLAGSCQDCPVEWDCVTCENSICIFRGCGGPADDDGTCTPACDTCTHCSQGRCYPDDICEDDSSSCVGTCGSCQVCRSDSCVRDGRCDMDDQESNGNEGEYCDGSLPCRACLQCENGACAVADEQACLDNLDVIITPPGPVIMPVGGTQRFTSLGGPLAGTYAWSSSDAGVARIQGSSTARNVMVEGVSPGTTTATVSFTAQGVTVTDSVEVTVVEVKPQQVSFSGNQYHQIESDYGNIAFDAPHWQDNSSPLDGDADDAGDRTYPVAFTRSTKMKVSARFILNPSPLGMITVKVRGDGPGNLDLPTTTAARAGNQVNLAATETSGTLADTVDILDPMRINWQISFDNGATWMSAGTSQNRVYVTWGDPVVPATSPYFHTLVHLGCKNAKGIGGSGAVAESNVVTAIWNDFTDPVGQGVVRVDGVQMGYWTGGIGTCQSLSNMLSSGIGDGSCVAWAQLFHQIIKTQGISGTQIFEIQADTSVNINADGFLVKNWNFGRHIRTGTNGINDSDTTGDDVALFPKGNGFPNKPCIGQGTNGGLDTVPINDDVVILGKITTGANGICETVSAGDDEQLISLGQGSPDIECVAPGANGVLDSIPGGDDTNQDGFFLGSSYPYLLFAGLWLGNPYGSLNGDVANQSGIPGQNNSEPPPFFFNHFITVYGNKVYDPSYGAGPYSFDAVNGRSINHENAAIDGIRSQDRAKKNSAEVELIYTRNIVLE